MRTAPLFLFFLLFSSGAGAMTLRELCAAVVGFWLPGAEPTAPALTDTAARWRPALLPLREKQLEKELQRVKDGLIYNYRSNRRVDVDVNLRKISVGDETFTVLRYLGAGDHGAVYQVKDKAGQLFVVKLYHDGFYQMNVEEELAEAHRKGIPSILLPDLPFKKRVDYARRTSMYRYVEGVPVNTVLSSSSVDPAIREEVSAAYEEWKTRYNGGATANPKNVVVDLSTGEFVLIDPR